MYIYIACILYTCHIIYTQYICIYLYVTIMTTLYSVLIEFSKLRLELKGIDMKTMCS